METEGWKPCLQVHDVCLYPESDKFNPSPFFYRVSIKSFPDYKHLLQENYVEYKHIFF